MAPKFGTSGLRGRVTELTPALVAAYTTAFLRSCDTGRAVYLGWDLRPSSPAIAGAVIGAIRAGGYRPVICGALPTPALALAAAGAGAGAVMITGSHIPADRNGLKFYTTAGEITKQDEDRILALVTGNIGGNIGGDLPGRPGAEEPAPADPLPPADKTALQGYAARYLSAFGPEALSGLRVGVYQHSSVARDLLVEAIAALGGRAVALGRTDAFVPVDTEAMDDATRDRFRGWCAAHRLDSVISTDGDADRPLVTDETGSMVPGDVLGALTARLLGARVICTPISSNTMISQMPEFTGIRLTRIGSPYVIAAMQAALSADPAARVAGYEANGGFLLGFAAQGPRGVLAPLMTRDCLLPILCTLAAARAAGQSLSALVAALPRRFTAANRLAEVPAEASARLIAALRDDAAVRSAFFETGAAVRAIDQTDGLRVRFHNDEVVHLRPSGNAPELRCYAEAASPARARALVDSHLARLRAMI